MAARHSTPCRPQVLSTGKRTRSIWLVMPLHDVCLGCAGEPVLKRKVVCMHEEDASMLWKHTESRTGRCEQRRSRRLVLSCIVTLANYEYGFNWMFYQVTSARLTVYVSAELCWSTILAQLTGTDLLSVCRAPSSDAIWAWLVGWSELACFCALAAALALLSIHQCCSSTES